MKIRSNLQALSTAWLRLFMFFCVALVTGSAVAAPREFSISPVPDWVRAVAPGEPAVMPTEQLSQGLHYLLIDAQTRVDASDRVSFRHIVTKALNERGVESVAQIEIRFDPSYQSLTLHMIQVRRGTRVIPKLASASVKVLQREQELEYRIYDGSKTANVFLDDIRVGDVVEYAYSVRGNNPVFGNRQFGRFDLQWGVPVHHLYTRLLWPKGRELNLAPRNTTMKPVVTDRTTHTEHVWESKDLAALRVESDTPNWFDPYPTVQWGDFKDWQSVARWAAPYYRVPAQLGPGLQAEVDRIARAYPAPQERLLAALKLVQSQIRYLGVEIGPGSHAPSSPQQVWERRFGDCKDKTLLTVTLLQALGIEARGALVNTGLRRGIREQQPSPYAFNHVLVRATLGGKHYWVDPTLAPQKGDLAHLVQPDYEAALVVDESTTALVDMTNDSSKLANRTIHMLYESQSGFDKPVHLTVTTVVQGWGAESLRNMLATENRENLQKRYLNFYARYYPKLTMAIPMGVLENEKENRLTLTEHYVIDEFWQHAQGRKRLEANIHAPDVDDYLRGPRESIRTSPLALAHPVNLTHTTEVRLPEAFDIKSETIRVDDASFEFERRRSHNNKVLLLVDSFRSRADHVAPAETARYAASLGRARDATGYMLYRGDGAPAQSAQLSGLDRFNWSVAMLGALLLAGFTWLARKVYRYDPPAATPAAPQAAFSSELNGISGWLLLPALGVVFGPIRLLFEFVKLLPSYAADTWAQLTTVGSSAYHALWAPLLLFELAANLGLIVLSVLLLVMFFQKRRGVPRLYIAMLIASVVVLGLDMALAQLIPAAAQEITSKEWGALARAIFAAAIWGSYFHVSERVKATFVRGREPAAASPPPAHVAARG